MIEVVLAVLCGLLLISGELSSGSSIGRPAGKLRPFATIIGVVSLVVGLLDLISLVGVLLVLGGWALAAGALGAVPGIGSQLERWGKRLRQVGWLLGVLLLAGAVLELLGWLGRPDIGGPPFLRP